MNKFALNLGNQHLYCIHQPPTTERTMSIFTKQAPVADCPAYTVYEREADYTGYVNITVADTLGLDSGKGFFRRYSPDSVVSYALEYNEDPLAAVERAKSRGHELHWINQDATCLSASPQAKERVIRVHIGMRVRFEGLLATIEAAPNNNLRFAPV